MDLDLPQTPRIVHLRNRNGPEDARMPGLRVAPPDDVLELLNQTNAGDYVVQQLGRLEKVISPGSRKTLRRDGNLHRTRRRTRGAFHDSGRTGLSAAAFIAVTGFGCMKPAACCCLLHGINSSRVRAHPLLSTPKRVPALAQPLAGSAVCRCKRNRVPYILETAVHAGANRCHSRSYLGNVRAHPFKRRGQAALTLAHDKCCAKSPKHMLGCIRAGELPHMRLIVDGQAVVAGRKRRIGRERGDEYPILDARGWPHLCPVRQESNLK